MDTTTDTISDPQAVRTSANVLRVRMDTTTDTVVMLRGDHPT
ncbi:MAG TPA: hypothetical protein VK478_09545 [Gemmatimonadaceae bacterium]|nr:hypothetical protein [Gemmatimonadaceae bacterium]